jgi:hypothetical protein
LVVYEPSLVQGWAEYLNEGKDKWKRGLVDIGKRARQKYLCKVWGERFGNDKDEAEAAKEPEKSLIVKLKFNGQKRKWDETSKDSSFEKQDLPSVKKQALSPDLQPRLLLLEGSSYNPRDRWEVGSLSIRVRIPAW